MRSSLPLLTSFFCLLSSFVFSQEIIVIGHRNDPIISRIDEPTNSFVGAGAGTSGIKALLPWPNATAQEKLFVVRTTGPLQTCSTTLTSFANLTSTGNPKAMALAAANGMGTHLAVVGQTAGNATSASFLDLVNGDNESAVDVFVSSDTNSNWTDVAFASNGTSYYKYAITDLRGTGSLSKLILFDVSAHVTNGPPYNSLPVQFSSQPVGVLSTYDLVAEQDLKVETYSSPGGGRFFIVGTSTFDCSATAGIQYGLYLGVHDAAAATGAPLLRATTCFGYIADTPTFQNLRVIGNFAFLTETLVSGGGNTGRLWVVNLRQWELSGWAATPPTGVFTTYSVGFSEGVDAIGSNLAQSKVYIGSIGSTVGLVVMYPVNVSLASGTAVTSAPANIPLLTAEEQNSINPPIRRYPGAFNAVDQSAVAGGGFGNGGGGGGNGSLCSTGSAAPDGLPIVALGLLLLLGLVRRVAS